MQPFIFILVVFVPLSFFILCILDFRNEMIIQKKMLAPDHHKNHTKQQHTQNTEHEMQTLL